ncbi:SdrD B-like domain-containing protein [Nonlabens xylanidelens]|uniref:SdrD B-like domain-containing protein n=1 Tax=Nonlabens xylanidelens TaxID=191564 RepID=UPI000CF52BC6|nr:SdrD B-like domain-containing protein [Nonlabens xylanidelens]PQJ13188.1 hypothetical protein BST94_16195 [Nonlabens xylanidelens]
MGHVYNDLNGNGTQDSGEPDLANVDVVLTPTFGDPITVTTDANGDYSGNVFAGDVSVNIDDTTLPVGTVQTEGTDPTTVVAVSGSTVTEENNGFNAPATLQGLVYNDVNGNGTQDAGEPGLSGVDVLITDEDGNAQTVTTDANGAYTAIVVAAGDATVDIDETTLPTGAVQTEGTDPTTVTVVSGTTVPEEENGFNTPGTIEGLVYDDVNGNGTQDAGEPGLSGVDVLITDEDGNAQTVTTDANGAYTATVVAAGDATVDIDETTLPTGAVQTEGTDPTTVTVVSGTTVPEEENGFNTPGTIEGLVYDDVNGNGTQDAGEPGLSGVDVLITDEDGNAQTVTTDANGAYTAIVVAAGDATVDIDETTLPTGAVQTEGTDPTTVTVVSGTTVPEEENGFNTPGTIEGLVYDDVNGNGTQDAGEPGLSGVDVLITDEDGNAQTVTTDANGAYTAIVVAAGDATVDIDETTLPTGAVQTEGTDPTTVTVVSGTTVPEEENGFNTPGTIEGLVYDDVNGNGTQDAGEPGLSGVDVLITDEDGNAQTVTTDANGAYTAIVVAAGDATVDIDETTLPTGAVQTEGTDPTTVTVVSGTTVPEEENGFNTPGTIEGLVYDDVNGNGTQDAGEPGLSGVDVLITDEDGNAQTVTTDANGAYTATVVAAGDATVDIDETTLPTGAVQTEGTDPTTVTVVSGTTVPEEENGFNTPGTIEGLVYDDVNGNGTQDAGEPGLSGVDVLITDEDGNAQTVTTDANGAYTAIVVAAGDATVDIDETTLPTGAVQTEGTDPTTVTVVSGTTVPEEENGFNTPGTIEGLVYDDVNGNGTQDAGEPGLSGVDVLITDEDGNAQTVTTDANGAYTAIVVAAGDATVDIDETTLPTGAVQTEGTDPTTVTVVSGTTVPEEENGFNTPGTIEGLVYDDVNGNGTQDAGEPGLSGVDVLITDEDGNAQTVTTDANGAYTAIVVAAGDATVDIDETTLPTGAVQTEGTDPTTVTVVSGTTVPEEENGFNTPGTIEGLVYDDVNGNGTQDAGEPGLSGVDVLITDEDGNAQTVTTDANGAYTAIVVAAGDATVDIDETTLPTGAVQTEGTDPTTVTVVSGTTVPEEENGFNTPGTIEGLVYDDVNGNGTQDAGEPGLSGVDVLITDEDGNAQTVTTDANGAYTAIVVAAGDATVDIDETTLPTGAVQTEGTDPTTVTVVSGTTVPEEENGFNTPGTIEGLVYDDVNGNGTQDAGEPGLSGVDVLITDEDGNAQTVTTDANGAYTAIVVAAGDATVDIDETTLPTGAVQTEGTDPTTVTVVSGTTVPEEENGFNTPGTIEGLVYDDVNGNGTQDAGEPGLSGVDVLITDEDGNAQTVTTDANGAYTAIVVAAGDATVDIDETTLPTGAVQTEGTDPTTVTVVSGTTVPEEENGFNTPGTIEGLVYDDVNGNGTQDAGEPGLSGVDVLITDEDGNAQTVTTDANGAYTAIVVAAGDATVDIDETTLPTGAVQTEGTDPTTVTVVSGTTVPEEENGFNTPGTIEGLVYDDVNGNGTQDAGEPGLSGVDVLITDEDGNAQTVTTDANGAYTAIVVAAGDATVDIDETTLPTGAVQTEGTDPTTVTVVSGTTVPEEENGFNTPGTIEGLVYDDVNGNGTQDAGEPGLSGVDVLITDEDGNAQTVTTDANGAYTAIVVAAGDATVDIDETTLPTGAVQTEGTDPTTVTVVSGTTVPEEENGFNTPGTIEGLVYDDVNGNGTQDAGEPGLSGVDVLITDEDGNAQTVTTDANGAYTAIVVAAGDATVDIDETTLPTGAVQTEGTDPTTVTVVSGTTVPEEENGFNTPGTIED